MVARIARILPVLGIGALGFGMWTILGGESVSNGAPDAAPTPRVEAFRKAYQCEQAQSYAEGVGVLRNLPREPRDYPLDLRLAWLQYLAGDHVSARKSYELALQDRPRAIEPRTAALLPLLARNDLLAVEQLARQVLALDANNYYANLRLAYVYRLTKKYVEAERIDRKMLRLYPSDYSFLIEMALVYSAEGRHDRAREFYRKVQLVSPDDTIAARALTARPDGMGNRNPNAAAFRKAVELESRKSYKEAAGVLGAIRPEDGQEYLVHARLGWLHYLAGDFAKSRSHYERAVRAAPQAVEPLIGQLLPLLAQRKFDEADLVAREALRLDPRNYYANLRLSYALRMRERFVPARAINETMLELYPASVEFLTEQALVQTALKQPEEAKKLYHQIQLLAPDSVLAREALAGK